MRYREMVDSVVGLFFSSRERGESPAGRICSMSLCNQNGHHYRMIGQQSFFRKIKVCGAVEHCVVH